MNRLKRLLLPFAVLLAFAGITITPYVAHWVQATVNEVTARNDYVSTGGAAYTYSFKILTKNDIEVLLDGAVQTVDTHYTVTGLGASGGGTVTFITAPASGKKIALIRKQPAQQTSVYTPNEAFPARRIETDLDKLQMQVQQLQEQLNRSLHLGKASTLTSTQTTIPETACASKYLRWNATAAGFECLALTSSGTITVPVSPNDGGTGMANTTGSTLAGLPPPGTAGRLARVTDNIRGIYVDTGTQWVRTDDVINVKRDFDATGNNTTDDAAAINAAFSAARTANTGVGVHFPEGNYRALSSINAGGFGNTTITVTGVGTRNGVGSRINGVFSTLNQPVFDFSGNEGGQILDLHITGDSTTIPHHGILLAGATAGAGDSFSGTRGGANYLQNVLVNGKFQQTAIMVTAADLTVFNHVQAGVDNVATASTLYVANNPAAPIYTAASAFRPLSGATGATSFHSMNGIWQPAGTTRSVWLIDTISRIVSSSNDIWVYGGSTATAIEFINSGNLLTIIGATHESGGGSFIKTDGFKDSIIHGAVQQNGTTPVIDISSTYGSASGAISNSDIRLSPSGVTANLINSTTADLLGNTITLLGNSSLTANGAARQSQGNFIINRGTGTISLVTTNEDDLGNIILSTTGLRFSGKLVGAGTGLGQPLSNVYSATRAAVAAADYSANPIAANTAATFTITVTGVAETANEIVHVSPAVSPGAGLVWSARISASNTVTVVVGNVTTAGVTPTTSDWRATVLKH